MNDKFKVTIYNYRSETTTVVENASGEKVAIWGDDYDEGMLPTEIIGFMNFLGCNPDVIYKNENQDAELYMQQYQENKHLEDYA